MTWEDLIQEAAQKLEFAGVEDARANAEYLAMKARGLNERHELRPKLRDKIAYSEGVAFTQLITRREGREPLQYILGEWEFFGLPIMLDPSVLIPRPETEILVEEAIRESLFIETPPRIIDLGTGSGAIALAMASQLPKADVVGIDISSAAISIAKRNAERLRLANVRFRVADMTSPRWPRPNIQRSDLVVSNPPYVSISEFDRLAPELRLYEPRYALTDESTGLTFYQRIAELAPALLTPHGRLLVELGFGLAEPVSEIMREAGMEVMRVVNDLAEIPRVLVAKFLP